MKPPNAGHFGALGCLVVIWCVLEGGVVGDRGLMSRLWRLLTNTYYRV